MFQFVTRPCRAAVLRPAVGVAMTLTGGAAAGDDPPCGGPMAAEVVHAEDDLAPGIGRPYQRFDRANVAVSADGSAHVAFTADLAGDVLTDDVAYVGKTLMLREGDPLADGTIADILSFDGQRAVNAVGVLAARVRLEGVPRGTDSAVVADGKIVARSGEPVPDGRGDRYASFDFVGIDDAGRVGFHARTDGPSSADSVIVLDGSVLYRKGDASPLGDGSIWDGRFDEVAWNAAGDLLFEGNLSGPSAADRVLVLRSVTDDGMVHETVVAREGDVPAGRADARLDVFEQVVLGDDGAWAARVLLREIGRGADEAVVDAAGIVAQEGDPVAGLPGAFLGPVFAVSIDADGRALAAADLTGAPPPGVEQVVLRGRCATATNGTQPVGLPGGTWISTIGFEDLVAGPGDALFFSASYGGEVSGDGIFRVAGGTNCSADLSGDGTVGSLDLVMLLQGWGPCAGTICPPDLDGDQMVDFHDLLELVTRWGDCE